MLALSLVTGHTTVAGNTANVVVIGAIGRRDLAHLVKQPSFPYTRTCNTLVVEVRANVRMHPRLLPIVYIDSMYV